MQEDLKKINKQKPPDVKIPVHLSLRLNKNAHYM